MTSKMLALTAAAGLLIASSTIAYAENVAVVQAGAKAQEKGSTRTAAVNAPGRVVQEDGTPASGTSFATSQGTTGMKDPTETYDRGPSVPSGKN